MYVGFNVVSNKEVFGGDHYYAVGKELFKDNKECISKALDDYIISKNELGVEEIMNDWFPQLEAQVFLSHSHKDEREVLALAGWLKEEAGIAAFIDSCVWGYYEDLIIKLSQKYPDACSVTLINQVRLHVYTMLQSALLKMIDNTECLMFYNTPNSIIRDELITGNPATYSPWIYSELLSARVLRRKSPDEHRNEFCHSDIGYKMQYPVKLDNLVKIDNKDMKAWRDKIREGKDAWGESWYAELSLDYLYKLKLS